MKGPILFLITFISGILIFLIVLKISTLKKYNLITRSGTFKSTDRFLIIFSVLAILISMLWDFNYLRFSKPIPHENWKSISLQSFKGLKKPKEKLDGQEKFAFVNTSIKVSKQKDRIVIESLFHPCRSYVYNKRLFADRLLTHEMYHFHITEYCARFMKKEILEYIEYGIDFKLPKFKRQVLVYEQSLQKQYDEETYHSYVLGKQLEWQDKIDSLLFSLEDYSNTIISLNRNKKK